MNTEQEDKTDEAREREEAENAQWEDQQESNYMNSYTEGN